MEKLTIEQCEQISRDVNEVFLKHGIKQFICFMIEPNEKNIGLFDSPFKSPGLRLMMEAFRTTVNSIANKKNEYSFYNKKQ